MRMCGVWENQTFSGWRAYTSPLRLALGLDVIGDELLLGDGRAQVRRVASGAPAQRRHARVGAVRPGRVAIHAQHACLPRVGGVAEFDRLRPAPVDDPGECDPSRTQGGQHTRQNWDLAPGSSHRDPNSDYTVKNSAMWEKTAVGRRKRLPHARAREPAAKWGRHFRLPTGGLHAPHPPVAKVDTGGAGAYNKFLEFSDKRVAVFLFRGLGFPVAFVLAIPGFPAPLSAAVREFLVARPGRTARLGARQEVHLRQVPRRHRQSAAPSRSAQDEVAGFGFGPRREVPPVPRPGLPESRRSTGTARCRTSTPGGSRVACRATTPTPT